MTKKETGSHHFYWHILLLGSLIFSHPLFKTIGGQPEFLLAHNLSGLNLLLWIMAIGLLPGLILVVAAYALNKLLPSMSKHLKSLWLLLLFSLFIFNNISDDVDSGIVLAAVISSLLAAGAVFIYLKTVFLRMFLSVAGLLVIITPLQFCFSHDVRQILMPQKKVVSAHAGIQIDKKPVVILLFDELPLFSLLDDKGNINAQRYPNFAEFAGHSTWYKYATTVAEATLNAVPPILTGNLTGPSNKILPIAANYPDNIFTLLSASHEINAFETFTQLCPEDLCVNTRPDWQLIAEDSLVAYGHSVVPVYLKGLLPQIDNKWVGYLRDNYETRNLHNDEEWHPHHRYKIRLEKFDRFMFELGAAGSASLNYMHILMPHSPWMYLPDGRVYSQAELRAFTGTLPSGSPTVTQSSQLYTQPHLTEYANQRHLLQAGYLDKLLGDVVASLRQRKLFDDALIIVMADHGASFRPGESLREANEASYQDILSIPLFIKYPAQKQAQLDLRAARTVDLLPTILDVLNSQLVDIDFNGQSLRSPATHDVDTIKLQRDSGRVLEFPFADFKQRFEHTISSRKVEFTNGVFENIYALNDQGLLNQTVEKLNVSEQVDYSLRLDSPYLYKNIDTTQMGIPTLIRATQVSSPEAFANAPVAVVVNGTIRAVSVLQKIDTVEYDFQALVSPDSFKPGNNLIRFYEVHSINGTTSLSPIPLETDNQVQLSRPTDDTDLLDFNSQQLRVSQSGMYGQVTIAVDIKTNQLRLTGWSANSHNGQVADEVFVFSGTELIASTRPQARYPQALETTGFKMSEYSGFNLVMPTRRQTNELQQLTAIAVFDSQSGPIAGELRYINNAKERYNTRAINQNQEVLSPTNDKSTIEPGRIYDFSDMTEAQQFSGAGWSIGSSSEARWNAAEEASLNFTAASNQHALDLIIQASPFFIKGKLETQIIEVSLRSGSTQQIHLQYGEASSEFTIHIRPEDIGSDGVVLIKLKFLNAASPKSLAVNSDPRKLAIKVKSLQVLIADKQPN